MAGSAVQLQNLGKRYLIGANKRRGYRTLQETIVESLSAPMRMIRAGGALGRTEEFWALRDVSFDIDDGEVVGVIGRNGAGKSTLLKILSGITPPTSGRAVLAGRVGSLLEVGTGFHQELSGRENIFLNGSILGMRRREIAKKFDAIVDYSGVDKFLDTPVKRYSSGMRVRLAFAVAAFLEPEILIVDEVLAVGDAEFQKKCLGTMSKVASSGRTVLFVSHNMAAIRSLCSRSIVLEQGGVAFDGNAAEGVDVYSRFMSPDAAEHETFPKTSGNATVHDLSIRSVEGAGRQIDSASGITISADVSLSGDVPRAHFLLVVWSADSEERIGSLASEQHGINALTGGQRSRIEIHMPVNVLPPGQYRLQMNLGYGGQRLAEWQSLCTFTVSPGCCEGASKPYTREHGVCLIPATIHVDEVDAWSPSAISAA